LGCGFVSYSASRLGVQIPTGPPSPQALWGQSATLVVRVELVLAELSIQKRVVFQAFWSLTC
jgi:hypothetical protein